MDSSEASLALARERLAQVPQASAHSVQFSTSLQDLPQQLDLALVVTPAHCRARVVSDLASCHQVKAWILEKVLAQSCAQLDQIERALIGNSQVWVNTPRRLMEYQAWSSAAALALPLQVRERWLWGLACNAIHFIDLLAWWTQASVRSVNPSCLGGWVKSKRDGFYEVCGTLEVFYTDGSTLELCCHSGQEPTQISVLTPQGMWLVEESLGRCRGINGQQLNGQLNFQSALTAPLVKQILQRGSCDLPTLAESIAQHQPLLDSLLKHWNRSQGCHDSVVPIT